MTSEAAVIGAVAALDTASFADLRAAFESSPMLVTVTLGAEHVLAYQNATARRLMGARPLGVPIAEAFPEFTAEALQRADEVLRTGTTFVSPVEPARTTDAAGSPLMVRYVFAPLGGGPGRPPAGVVYTASDVTAEAQAARAAEEYRLLGELQERMNAAADPDKALQALTAALVPGLADVAAVFVQPADERRPDAVLTGGRRPLPDTAPLPVALTVSEALADRVGMPPSGGQRRAEPSPWTATLAAGRPLIIPILDDEGRSQLANDASTRWALEAGAHNIAVLPLTLAGELAGAVVLLAAGERAPYTPGDLPFLQRVATRAGAAVTHLRSYRQQRQIALDLQRALLPAVPPELPGVQLAVRYVAGAADVDVGGDWWEVHPRGPGLTGVGIGDVSGRGTQAAVVMGQARAAMRSAALADLGPGCLLDLLDAQLAESLENAATATGGLTPRFATAAYTVLDHHRQVLRIARAGHPPVLVRRPDASIEVIAPPAGPPVGLGVGGYEVVQAPFPTGSTLVAFTDGLVESRDVDVDAGVEQLRQSLQAVGHHHDLETLADALLDAMGRRYGHEDDVALVVVRSVGG